MSTPAFSMAIKPSGAGVNACAAGARTATSAPAANMMESFLSIVDSLVFFISPRGATAPFIRGESLARGAALSAENLRNIQRAFRLCVGPYAFIRHSEFITADSVPATRFTADPGPF
jgi:hypothetical protein